MGGGQIEARGLKVALRLIMVSYLRDEHATKPHLSWVLLSSES